MSAGAKAVAADGIDTDAGVPGAVAPASAAQPRLSAGSMKKASSRQTDGLRPESDSPSELRSLTPVFDGREAGARHLGMGAIPAEVADGMARQRGEVVRGAEAVALAELERLQIPRESQFASFFLRYRVSPVVSRTSLEELMDLVSPSPQIRYATDFVQGTYGVPARFVCLTSAEGEGFYLYERETEAVYDVSCASIPALVAGTLRPRWTDLFRFLAWYLA